MKGFNFKKELIIWVILIVPFIFSVYYWDNVPQQMITHWGIDGKPNGWSNKNVGLFGMPMLSVVMYLLFLVYPKIDPKKRNFELFGNAYYVIRLSIAAFIGILSVIVLYVNMGCQINIGKTVITMVSLLMLLYGNVLGNIRHNYFVGIRVPWTLNNEEVWRLTHRLAGKIWVIASIIMLPICIFVPVSSLTWIFIAYMTGIFIYPMYFSYKTYKELNKDMPNNQ